MHSCVNMNEVNEGIITVFGYCFFFQEILNMLLKKFILKVNPHLHHQWLIRLVCKDFSEWFDTKCSWLSIFYQYLDKFFNEISQVFGQLKHSEFVKGDPIFFVQNYMKLIPNFLSEFSNFLLFPKYFYMHHGVVFFSIYLKMTR